MNARTIGKAAIAATACAMAFAGTSWACGDKLVALGGGVGFERLMVSRNPSHIILMLEPATGLATANDKFHLVASLSLAGHEVSVVRNAGEFLALRAAAAPDLVLVDATRANQLRLQPAADGQDPMIMPIAYSADGGVVDTAAPQAGCVTVASGRKGTQLLKAIEQTLKLRSRGLPMACEKNANSKQA